MLWGTGTSPDQSPDLALGFQPLGKHLCCKNLYQGIPQRLKSQRSSALSPVAGQSCTTTLLKAKPAGSMCVSRGVFSF